MFPAPTPTPPPTPQYDPLAAAPSAAGPAARPARPPRKWPIILVFCLFAGLIPETIVTSSTSPLKMLLNPVSLPFIALFYGTADLLIREIIVRRRVGLASVLLLGAAFGFVNEGVAAGTWYTVRSQGYAYFGGVNWAWALALTIFHTIISVIVPIAFIEILFPSIAGKPLLRRRGMVICAALFLGFALLVALTPLYRPYRLAALAVAVLFALLALLALPPRRAIIPAPMEPPLMPPPAYPQAYPAPYPTSYPTPQSTPQPTTRPLPGLWRLRIAGFLTMFGYFIMIYLVPVVVLALVRSVAHGVALAQVVDGAVFLAFSALVIWRGWSWSRRAGWSPRQNLALLVGGVAFTTLVMFIPQQVALGEPFATVPFLALLVVLSVRRPTPPIPFPHLGEGTAAGPEGQGRVRPVAT